MPVSHPRVDFIPAAGGVLIPTRVYESNCDRIPVVLIHGLQSHSGWFMQSASFLSNLGFPVYAFDRRGSGLSKERRGDCSNFMEMAADLTIVSDYAARKHSAQKVHMLGHCFGAIPATAFTCEYPDRVQSLVLSTPGIYTSSDLHPIQKMLILWRQITGKTAYVSAPIAPEMFSDLDEWVAFVRADSLALREVTSSFFYEVHRARQFIRKNVAKLTMPVFMAIAASDAVCDNKRNRRFFASVPSPRKELIEYSDARHILEFSRERDRFFSDLKKWFEST
jgi:alpha-beta hydrolase superfamily lysophospholipase